jgi:predicted permease
MDSANMMGSLRRWFRRRDRLERELDDELRFHVEAHTRDLVANGMAQGEARRIALAEFGGLEPIRQVTREAHRWRWLDELLSDVRYAFRVLRRSPATTGIIILTLALGIGANTAIFSVTDALLMRMLPVREPERLVLLQGSVYSDFLRSAIDFDGFPNFVYETFRDHAGGFTGVMFVGGLNQPDISIDGNPETFLEHELVSRNFFAELGVRPILGRPISSDTEPMAVISYEYWRRRFGGDRAVLGKTITVNHVPLEIGGVAPEGFFGITPDRPKDLWMPVRLFSPAPGSDDTGSGRIIARLKPGVTAERAGAELTALYAGLPEEKRFTKGSTKPADIHALSGGQGYSPLREKFGRSLTILMIVVSTVLLTACANVASLQLARGMARRTEIRTRLAIGAGRGRLIRQLLTENLLLSACGGAAGLALAVWGNHALLALLPERSRPGTLTDGSSPLAIHLDGRMLGFTVAISLLTGLLFGLAPALRATRANLVHGVRSGAGHPRDSLRLNRTLVVTQVAMSLVLLLTAGLFVRTLDKLRSVDLGFNPQNLLQISLATREAGYRGPQVTALYQELLERLARLPGVTEVSGVRNGLVQGGSTATTVTIPGRPSSPEDNIPIDSADVGPRFFATAGMPLVAGRDFTANDDARSARVIVVNQSFVRRYLGTGNPLRMRVATGGSTTSEIVGVVRDARIVNLRQAVGPTIYFPAFQRNMDRVSAIELRTTIDPIGVIAAARREVSAINPKLVVGAKTMSAQIDDVLMQERMIGKLSAFFGVLALMLASGGLYGLMAYSVARRTGEIGIRMALGAPRDSVLWMVLRETMTLLLAGLAIGVPLALGLAQLAGHWIEGLLFEMKATDPVTLLMAVLLLGVAAVVAGAMPARRASQVDPMKALRSE